MGLFFGRFRSSNKLKLTCNCYVLCKIDDGALSLDEFKAFFRDGILSNEDLEKLFHDIDTHNTK